MSLKGMTNKPISMSAKATTRAGVILGVLSLLLFIGLGTWFWQTNAAQDRADQEQTLRLAVIELNGQNLATQLDGQRAQFEACKDAPAGKVGCDLPVAPPAALVAPQIVTGPPGPQGYPGLDGPGPSTAQIAGAVAVYLAAHPAPAGADGVTPDPDVIDAQIRTAVALYLTSNPPSDGAPGPAGADATDIQVAAAVVAYCDAHAGCVGLTGADGATGATGATGADGSNGNGPPPTTAPTPTPTSTTGATP